MRITSQKRLHTVGLLLLGLAEAAWTQPAGWQAAIVQVSAKGISPGTGFIVALRPARAYLVTCAHVVAGDPSPAAVFLADRDKNPYRARVVAIEGEDTRGLALLQVEKPPVGLRVIEAGRSEGLAPGSSVVVAGYPASIGAFSVLPATVASIKGREIYLSPETVEGFSGGPVVLDGAVAGIVFGREEGFGRALRAGSLEEYLRGNDIEWGAPRLPATAPPPAQATLERLPDRANDVLSAGTRRRNPVDGMTYVWIPPGEFQMGCSPGDGMCNDDEKPPRTVRITRGFWLGQTEVTAILYDKFAAKAIRPRLTEFNTVKDNADWNRPVVGATWEEAEYYCGKNARGRLPSEAEWEYAARAGTTGPSYGQLDEVAWYVANSGDHQLLGSGLILRGVRYLSPKYRETLQKYGNRVRPVAEKQPSPWGLNDMLGNAWEWVADWYQADYYQTEPSRVKDPKGPASGTSRVMRGGAWDRTSEYARASTRGRNNPQFRNNSLGFRCALDVLK